VFFGLMATAGTAYVQAETVSSAAWWSGTAMGFLAVAILVVNNLRDIPTDAASGKRTLAVRLGERRTRRLYRGCVVAAFAAVVLGVLAGIAADDRGLSQWTLLALAAWVVAIRPMERIGAASGRDLVPVLVDTGLLQIAFGGLLALGLWIAGATSS
jgi:1,4-dihydroxy-2-naphthoate octaprenyltransferase